MAGNSKAGVVISIVIGATPWWQGLLARKYKTIYADDS
jgi:hypothetical protein